MYRSLRKVIDLLDQRRAQVLVESLIVEITENDGAELGSGLAAAPRVRRRELRQGHLHAWREDSIQALPKGGLSIGVISGTIAPALARSPTWACWRARCRPREAATCCPRRTL